MASDEYEGRETGEKGQKMSAEYIAKEFESYGLPKIGDSNTYFQYIPLHKEFLKDATIKVESKEYAFLKDFYTFSKLANTKNIKINSITVLGYGIISKKYNDYLDINKSVKAILLMGGEPRDKKGKSRLTGEKWASPQAKWKTKVRYAQENGVETIFFVDKDADNEKFIKMIKYKIEHAALKIQTKITADKKDMDVYFISPSMADFILAKQGMKYEDYINGINKKGKPNNLNININIEVEINKEDEPVIAENVLGYIEGTDLKDEVVIVTAHYDHLGIKDSLVYNGADDDGSGTVAVIEMAQAFALAKKEGHGPRRSVLFMPVSGEEKGLLGSKYYASNPVLPLENTVADLNIDMIGRLDKDHEDNPNYVYLIGTNMLSTELHDINEQANKDYVGIDLDYKYNALDDPNRFYYRSDHYNFAKNNIPVIFYFNGTHVDYHKHTDTIDKINFLKMEKITRLVYFTAWELANRDQRIVVDVKEEK